MAYSKETLALLGLDENATDEQVSAKIADLNSAKVKAEGERDKFKSSFDKTSTELSNLKKEKMTDEEKKQAELKDIQDRLAEAEKKNKLNDLERQYLSSGMDSETATAMAKAVMEGDFAKQGELMKTHNEKLVKEAKIEALKNNPKPKQGDPNIDTKFTKENFKKGLLSMEELNKLKAEDPAKYKEIVSE